ncbi:MAG TPA: hypothetical protein PKW98_00085, partial [Candidatus Wallbacteria bacterium]|nr:hypothetical protein [Candidatus Wallbacteria bacterium]
MANTVKRSNLSAIIGFSLAFILCWHGFSYAQITSYQPPYDANSYQSFNTDQIYNPLIGGSSDVLSTQYTMPVPGEQPNAAQPDEFNIKKKLPIFVNGDYVEYRTIEDKVVA